MGEYRASYNVYRIIIKKKKIVVLCGNSMQQVLSRATADVGLIASHLRRVLLLQTAGHSLRSGFFCVSLDDGPVSSLFV